MSQRRISVLTIAGSDSGGGAGIQADLKTFAAHDVHGVCALAALTAQNTRGVSAVHVPPLDFLRAQIDACFEDFDIGAVKIGMLATADVIEHVADALERWKPACIVLDPVMVASSGARLLEPSALAALRQRLIPMATVLTPNIPEAELLLEHSIVSEACAEKAVHKLHSMGSRSVLLKGGHLVGSVVVDRLFDGTEVRRFEHARLPIEGHGTGCTLAAAIAARMASGDDIADACTAAGDYVHGALLHSYPPGRGGLVVLDHFWQRTGA